MAFNLKQRDLLKMLDFTTDEINYLIDLSIELKKQRQCGLINNYLKNKNIVIMFQKTSTRTRCSFEVAARELGMGVTFLDSGSSQFGKKESIADTAKVLSRYYDGIEFRGFAQKDVEELAKYASVPVWNGLTNESHPTQMIADMMTIKENFGHLKGLKLVYCGDARFNMANSLMVTCAKLGMHFVGCAPKKFWADKNLIKKCQEICTVTGGKVEFMERLEDAAKRELKEETDLDAVKLEFLCVNDDMTETAHYVTVGFIAREYEGEPKAMEPETILEWKWFDMEELPENLYEPSRKCIKKYKKGIIYE